MRRVLLACVAVALVATACSDDPETLAIVASSDLAIGTERVLVGLALPDGTRLGSPDLAVDFFFYPEDDPDSAHVASGSFMWIVENGSGLYRVDAEFDRPGIWFVEAAPEDGGRLEPVAFQVRSDPFTPAVGETAPASDSLTSADAALEEITTDPDPDPRFYEMSVAEAVTSGRPSVLVFATPAFCQTAACGPMLEDIKSIAGDHPDVNFVHVEIYEDFEPGVFPGLENLAPAVVEWGLNTEPWVFVVDQNGSVAARFEGVLDIAELAPLLS